MSQIKQFLLWFFAPSVVLVVIAVLVAVVPEPAPRCPTEDSCTASYEDGHWTITEVTP